MVKLMYTGVENQSIDTDTADNFTEINVMTSGGNAVLPTEARGIGGFYVGGVNETTVEGQDSAYQLRASVP